MSALPVFVMLIPALLGAHIGVVAELLSLKPAVWSALCALGFVLMTFSSLFNGSLDNALVFVFFAAFLYTFAQPDRALKWGLLMGLGVPAGHLFARLTGFHLHYPLDSSGVCWALVLGLAGAYAGVLLRRATAYFITPTASI